LQLIRQFTPRSSLLTLVVLYALSFCGWLFVVDGFNSPSWYFISFAALASAIYLFFGVSFYAGMILVIPSLALPWHRRRILLFAFAGGFLTQVLLSGAMVICGFWPPDKPWYLGVLSLVWQ
jgi:hypothetical protein